MSKVKTKLRFKRIEVNDFAFSSLDNLLGYEDIESNMYIGLKLNFSFIPDDSVFIIATSIIYKLLDEIILNAKISYSFELTNFANSIKLNEDSSFSMDDEILLDTVGMAVNTSRGIIWEKISNETLKSIPLPPVDIKTLAGIHRIEKETEKDTEEDSLS